MFEVFMICVLCGLKIENQTPIPTTLEFKPPITAEIIGLDTLTAKYCCQSCYSSVMKNAASASEFASKESIEANK